MRQAITDLRDALPSVRAGAAAFLAGSDSLVGWCSVAGLDPNTVIRQARPLLPRSTASVLEMHRPQHRRTLAAEGCGHARSRAIA